MSIAKNTAYGIGGAIIPLIVAIGTVPLYLHLVGNERYGALTIAWLFLGYFGLFDFGLGRATTQRIAALTHASRQERSDVFWTAVVVNLGLGVVGAVVLYFAANYFFEEVFKVSDALRSEVVTSVPILALSVPVATLTGVVSGALVGRERFLAVSTANLVGNLLYMIFPLIVAYLVSPYLPLLIGAALLARVVALTLFFRGTWVHVIRGCAARFDRGQWRALTAFGGWVGLSAVVGPVMLMSDRFIIGSTLGALAVTIYSVPFQLASRFAIFPVSFANVMFPRLSAELDPVRARAMSVTATQSTGLIFLPPVIGAICVMRPFLQTWLGAMLDPQAVLIGQIALVGFWMNGIATVPFAMIQARGNSRYTALVHMAELLPYLAVLFALGSLFGLAGICAAFGIRCAADLLILDRKAHGPRSGVVSQLAIPTLFFVGAIYASAVITGFAASIALGIGAGLVTLAFALWRLPRAVRTGLIAMVPARFRPAALA